MSEEDIKKNVMKKIKDSKVQMHSSAYFKWLTVALYSSVAVTTVLSAIFINLSILELEDRGFRHLFGVFPAHPRLLISAVPWLLVAFLSSSIFLLAYLLRKFDISYKYRYYGLAGLVIVPVITLSLIFTFAGVNRPIRQFGPFEKLGKHARTIDQNRISGTVVSLGESEIIISTSGRVITVEIAGSNQIPVGLNEGDSVQLLVANPDSDKPQLIKVLKQPHLRQPGNRF